ncbi:hypothetical protein CN692_24175 [Bacillus sp. AFS002410]|uniref:SGNH/GDSL hydrolase family protein n=1 Tax=Bacillus sp. AFS002410 TaxID=2033481 RepID=UPI000BEFF697|nr:SGNH/GDSL hydrolase family protein [Bacillus sp. AFS002410]PEJ48207.1 hypothetical protein CN692_24175 [Bacillus sp. AFS002410]
MRSGGVYLALGDSITYGSTLATTTPYGTYAAKIRKSIADNYGDCRLINKGISGWKSGDFLTAPHYWSRIEADLVTIHIGTNDCSNSVPVATFQSNLDTVVKMLKKRNPNVEIILCSISRRADAFANSLDPFRTAVATVATNNNTLLCYFENAWTQGNTATYTAVDLLHPNTTGHQALHDVLFPIVQQTKFVQKLGK